MMAKELSSSEEKEKKKSGIPFEAGRNLDIKKSTSNKPKLSVNEIFQFLVLRTPKPKLFPQLKKQKNNHRRID